MPKRNSFRDSLAALRHAYQEGDAQQLHDAYVHARKTSRFMAALLPVLEKIYPVCGFLDFASRLENCMSTDGLHLGCEKFFNELNISWRIDLPASIRDVAENSPVLFFGNHPSLFTPFLVAASVNRPDLRFFSAQYVGHLLPSVGKTAFPIEVPLTRSWTEWRRSGWQRVLVYRLISLIHDLPQPDDIRASNQASIAAGADHIRNGGSAIICPGGGGKSKDRKWYAGIGSLVKQLHQSPGNKPAYLLPFREENCSNKRIYAYLQKGPVARFKNAVIYRGPVCIRFGEPIAISEIGAADAKVQPLVDELKQQYECLFAKPQTQ
ncbi:hypothetical protein KKG90_04385 [Candidatus Bipolaricaulota bacterium]|nr:hypothetical protein [Candidatus Bipolaricaulota bacterium]